jgi:antitoxin YefM
MRAISYSQARENLKAVIDQAVSDKAPIAITRQRGEGAVLVSASEWASIEETLYLLRSPANAQRLLDAVRSLEAGEGQERPLTRP